MAAAPRHRNERIVAALNDIKGVAFKYPIRYIVPLIFATSLFVFGISVLYIYWKLGDLLFDIVFFTLSGITGFAVLSGFAMTSSILVSSEEIAALKFGVQLKRIKWKDVTKLKKWRYKNPASGAFEEVFYVYDGNTSWLSRRLINFYGPIAFNEKVTDVRALLDEINAHAREHHFPMFVLDQEVVGARSKTEVQVDAL